MTDTDTLYKIQISKLKFFIYLLLTLAQVATGLSLLHMALRNEGDNYKQLCL